MKAIMMGVLALVIVVGLACSSGNLSESEPAPEAEDSSSTASDLSDGGNISSITAAVSRSTEIPDTESDSGQSPTQVPESTDSSVAGQVSTPETIQNTLANLADSMSQTSGDNQQPLLGTWQCQIQLGDEINPAVYDFESESSLLIDGVPFSYALLPEGISIGGATFTLGIVGDSLAMTHPEGFQIQCERPTSATASQQDSSRAVELEPGRTYTGGTLVVASQLGVSFQIPEGWSGGLLPGTDVMVLGSATRQGTVFVMGQQSTNVGEVVAILNQPVPLDQTTVLTPITQPQVDGQWVIAVYTGFDGTNTLAGFGAALVDPAAKGVFYLASGPEDDSQYFIDLTGQLIDATESGPVAADVPSASTPVAGGGTTALAREWEEYLAGQLMTYLSSYSNEGDDAVFSSSNRKLYLCSDGQFAYEEESSVSVDVEGIGGFDSGGESDTGRWRIITEGELAGLELTWSSGEISAHKLDYVGGETQLDGERWFVTDDNPYCN